MDPFEEMSYRVSHAISELVRLSNKFSPPDLELCYLLEDGEAVSLAFVNSTLMTLSSRYLSRLLEANPNRASKKLILPPFPKYIQLNNSQHGLNLVFSQSINTSLSNLSGMEIEVLMNLDLFWLIFTSCTTCASLDDVSNVQKDIAASKKRMMTRIHVDRINGYRSLPRSCRHDSVVIKGEIYSKLHTFRMKTLSNEYVLFAGHGLLRAWVRVTVRKVTLEHLANESIFIATQLQKPEQVDANEDGKNTYSLHHPNSPLLSSQVHGL